MKHSLKFNIANQALKNWRPVDRHAEPLASEGPLKGAAVTSKRYGDGHLADYWSVA